MRIRKVNLVLLIPIVFTILLLSMWPTKAFATPCYITYKDSGSNAIREVDISKDLTLPSFEELNLGMNISSKLVMDPESYSFGGKTYYPGDKISSSELKKGSQYISATNQYSATIYVNRTLCMWKVLLAVGILCAIGYYISQRKKNK